MRYNQGMAKAITPQPDTALAATEVQQALDVYRRELRRAHDRVGVKANDIMNWLLRFVETDVRALSAGQWALLEWEIDYVCLVGSYDQYSKKGLVTVPQHFPLPLS